MKNKPTPKQIISIIIAFISLFAFLLMTWKRYKLNLNFGIGSSLQLPNYSTIEDTGFDMITFHKEILIAPLCMIIMIILSYRGKPMPYVALASGLLPIVVYFFVANIKNIGLGFVVSSICLLISMFIVLSFKIPIVEVPKLDVK